MGISRDLATWRSFFAKSESDIWTIIENALLVAAADNPQELRARRDRYAEQLFTCTSATLEPASTGFPSPYSHDAEGLVPIDVSLQQWSVPNGDVRSANAMATEHHHHHLTPPLPFGSPDAGPATSPWVEDDTFEGGDQRSRDGDNAAGQSTFSHMEALSELERSNQQVGEILELQRRIHVEEPEAKMIGVLSELEKAAIGVETLQATEIGKSVRILRKHSSPTVRAAAKALVRSWKTIVADWMQSAEAIAKEASKEGGSDGDAHEGGLPSPPLDADTLNAARLSSNDIAKLYDDLYCDDPSGGSPDMVMLEDITGPAWQSQEPPEPEILRRPMATPSPEGGQSCVSTPSSAPKVNKATAPPPTSGAASRSICEGTGPANGFNRVKKMSEPDRKPGSGEGERPRNGLGGGGSGERPKNGVVGKLGEKERSQDGLRKGVGAESKGGIVRREGKSDEREKGKGKGAQETGRSEGGRREVSENGRVTPQQKSPTPERVVTADERLAAAKRKLAEGYQEAMNAKRQRKVQVMDVMDLPGSKAGGGVKGRGSSVTLHRRPNLSPRKPGHGFHR